MSLGLIGRKVGMTRLFTDEGEAIPVTVIDVSDNRVAQVKTQATDGYDAVQLAHGTRRASRVTKAMAGHFAKAGVMAGNALNEFRIDSEKLAEMKPGQVVGVDVFTAGKRLTCKAFRLVKVTLEPLSAITLHLVAPAMVILVHTMFQVRLVWPKIQVACFLVSV